ncbi:rhomboid family intramembrane serine protease [Terrimonas sp. NA20]|uniref:Rhomboid family intramembrane serine protease n=1 Tax=Terrimonas ginsenosidimutans TaxID=2908004 RepID=A0ABS9KUV3_9BACT|nr:rhomboid family intramembrane serine protease [Terrimonas ginsenosidimutans]MCG2616091.1 rhomboid family intramembrane serine protease [Terrimonas ginsenosidimutans]
MNDYRYTRPEQFPPIVKNLIIINALVFVAQLLFDSQINLTHKLAMWPIIPEQLKAQLILSGIITDDQTFKPYQIATHFFTHSTSSFFHILFNMFTLWMFGRTLENIWGPKRFLFFYLCSGVGAAALHLTIQYFRAEPLLAALESNNEQAIISNIGALAPAVGASGAVMGLMAAFAYLFPNTEFYMMFIPVPIKAKWLVLGYAAIDLFGGVANIAGDNIAHFAHLGGAITGFIIVFIWNKNNRRTFY